MIIGRHPILDAIEAGKEIDRLVLQRGVNRDFEREIKEISRYPVSYTHLTLPTIYSV